MNKLSRYIISDPLRVYCFILIGYLIQQSALPERSGLFKLLIFGFYGLGYVFGAIQLFFQKWTRHSFVWACFLILLGLLVFIFNGNIGMEARLVVFNLAWVLVCSKGMKLDDAIRADLKIRIPFTILLFALCRVGLLTNVSVLRNYSRARYAWGFSHPNTTGSVYFLIVLYSAYLRREKLGIVDLGFQLAMAILTYSVPNSQTGTIGILMVALFTIYHLITVRLLRHRKYRLLSVLKKVMIASPIFIVALMFGLSLIYNPSNNRLAILNRLLTSRLEQGSKIMDYYRPTLFGNNVMRMSWNDALEMGINTAVVGSDILYVYLYTTFGILTLALYLFIMVKNLQYSGKQNLCLTYFMVVMAVISCIENPYVNVGSNIFLLCFGAYLYRSKARAYRGSSDGTISPVVVEIGR